jgi:hypothetical protein
VEGLICALLWFVASAGFLAMVLLGAEIVLDLASLHPVLNVMDKI